MRYGARSTKPTVWKYRGRPPEEQVQMNRHDPYVAGRSKICGTCGRRSELDEQGKPQGLKWKEQCVPLTTYRQLLDLGHRPRWAAKQLYCKRCKRDCKPLRTTVCGRRLGHASGLRLQIVGKSGCHKMRQANLHAAAQPWWVLLREAASAAFSGLGRHWLGLPRPRRWVF